MSLNILILTASHPYRASGVVALDMMKALKGNDNNVQIISKAHLEKEYADTQSVFEPVNYWKEKIIRKILKTFRLDRNVDSNFCMHSLNLNKTDRFARKILKKLSPGKPDLIIYLFPRNFLGPKDLHYLSISYNTPILWIMMDMSPFTGGCHYAWTCVQYQKKCGSCPGLYSESINDSTYENWTFMKEYYDKTNLIPVAASQAQFEQAKLSSLFRGKKVFKSYIPIDFQIFKSADKREVRARMELPKDKKIILFGAVSIVERRKGLKELIEILSRLNKGMSNSERERVFIIIAGQNSPDLQDKIPFEHKYLGYLNYSNLAKAYQAADLFISPSIEDSGPMMINQAISCGTPVVSFNIGIAQDLIIQGETGFKADLFNIKEMVKGINFIINLSDTHLLKMQDECIRLSRRLLSYSNFSKSILEIANECKD